jgi:hypothetical protein
MFATSFPAYPLTFTYVAEAEAPQGKADVLEGKGPNNFTMRLFVSRDTHLPLMVTWTAPAPQRGRGPMPPGAAMPQRGDAPGRGDAAGRGNAPARGDAPASPNAPQRGDAPARGAAAAPQGAGGGPAPGVPPENRLYFADYRDVDGLQLPFRLRRAVGPDTVEETTFDRFRLNSKIDPKRFEVRK